MILLSGFMMCNCLQTCLSNALRGARGSSQMKPMYRPAPKPRKVVSNIFFCSSTLSTSFVVVTMLNTSTYESGIGAVVKNWMRMFIVMC